MLYEVITEFNCTCVDDIAGLIEKPVLDLYEHFRLAKRRHIQVGEDVSQMLLRQGRSDLADGCAQYTSYNFV